MTLREAVTLTAKGSGLISRAASGLLFVMLARTLSPVEFGSVAVIVGLAIALAAFMTTSLSDSLVYLLMRNAKLCKNCAALAVMAVLAISLLAPVHPYVSLFAMVLAHGVVYSLERACRGATPALISYLVLAPVARMIGVLLSHENARSTMLGMTIATAVVAVGGAVVVFVALSSRRPRASMRPTGAPSLPGTTAVMSLSASIFLLLSQVDVVALAILAGPRFVAQYVPTMKVMEALTAIGAYWAAHAPLRFLESKDRIAVAWSLSRRVVAAYVILCLPVLVSGAWLVPWVFGSTQTFEFGVALPLAVGYAGLVGVSPLLQWAAFSAQFLVALRSVASMLLGLPMVLLGAAHSNLSLVASGLALCYMVGALAMSRQLRLARRGVSVSR